MVSTIAFTACGGDDDSTDDNGSNRYSSKHITKIIEEEDNSMYESTLSYDSQGRLIKVVETESSASINGSSEMTYQYGETLIITKQVRKSNYSNGQSFTDTEQHSYNLENGLIVKDIERQGSSSRTSTYSYDSNNNLISVSVKDSYDNYTMSVNWINGNINNIVKETNYTGTSTTYSHTYSYSNVSWPKGFPYYLKGSNFDSYLFSMGYYGNVPKYLPSKVAYSENSESGWTYDYTMQGNLITKLSIKPFVENNKRSSSIITYFWE